ncbi:MAG: ATP synthase F1 subunit gamma [Defluviitaleaceae bacterium]|nr:ATP synthase F1 subunit gamma [Defluviitaleaceae bacterium]
MPSMIDIKSRMKSIKGTQQMTKAMNLVASSKLGRAKQKLFSSRPFTKESQRIISNILDILEISEEKTEHPFFVNKKGKSLFIIITSDRGLCGGYNTNAIKEVEEAIYENTENNQNAILYTIGKRCSDYFIKRGRNILVSTVGISEQPTYYDAKIISDKITKEFLSGNISSVFITYTYFESIISHKPIVERILPIDPKDLILEDNDSKGKDLTIYEPGIKELLEFLLPKYITTKIYDSLVESATCEQGARMTSMDSATKNAKEALANMNLIYNRARQSAITQEISEIVGGANAIQQG